MKAIETGRGQSGIFLVKCKLVGGQEIEYSVATNYGVYKAVLIAGVYHEKQVKSEDINTWLSRVVDVEYVEPIPTTVLEDGVKVASLEGYIHDWLEW